MKIFSYKSILRSVEEGNYSFALSNCPRCSSSYFNLGNIFFKKGLYLLAIQSYKNAIKYEPGYSQAYYNLGNSYYIICNISYAIKSYRKAIDLNTFIFDCYLNLSIALQANGDLDSSISYVQKAILIRPEYVVSYFNLGNIYQEAGRIRSAINCYEKSISIDPDFVDAHQNLAMSLLLEGNYKIGWIEYEWRLRKKNKRFNTCDRNTINNLFNSRPIQGDKILIISEQGIGDNLQFMRYIPYLRDKGVEVSFASPGKLHGLIKTSGIHPDPIALEDVNSIKDRKWMHLLSLPRWLGVSPHNPIISDRYITAPRELRLKWKNILRAEKRPLIAINWQGNPTVEIGLIKGRSLPLATFNLLLQDSRFKFLSLQKGFGSEQLSTCAHLDSFVQSQEQINQTLDFEETSAIIANCDLIITSDTSMAHLAGAMGKPTFLLLKNVPDWRWGIGADKTFWYPNMLLIRQTTPGNWNEMMYRVYHKLKDYFSFKD